MGKPSRGKRPMTGFSKVTFGDDGAASSVVCPLCKKSACFCNRGLQRGVDAAAVMASPAGSVLSVSLKADKSPTFTFSPYSGYGNTSPPPDFELNGTTSGVPRLASVLEESPGRARGFFGGGSPSWILDGWQFALSIEGVPGTELHKLIERHGGEVTKLKPGVHALVATELAATRATKRVRVAREMQIPRVSPAFIHDSLRAGEAMDLDAYTSPAPSGGGPAATVERTFCWRREMRVRLQKAEGRALRRRVLRTEVLAAHAAHLDADSARWWATHPGEHQALFKRKLLRAKRDGRLITEGRVVRWAK